MPDGVEALNYSIRVPKGVVGVICPWNAPFLLMTWKVGPALACGNTVVVKPAPQDPLAVAELCRIVDSVLPPGVVNFVNGSGPEIGEALATISSPIAAAPPEPQPEIASSVSATPPPSEDVVNADTPPARLPSAPEEPIGEPATRGDTTVERLPRIRQTIARRMLESLHTSAQLTTVVDREVRDRAAGPLQCRLDKGPPKLCPLDGLLLPRLKRGHHVLRALARSYLGPIGANIVVAPRREAIEPQRGVSLGPHQRCPRRQRRRAVDASAVVQKDHAGEPPTAGFSNLPASWICSP